MREPIIRVNAKSQQFALRSLGLYTGPIDGQWTAECIRAQKELWRLHGGSCRDGQIMREPHNVPRHFEWSRLDNQSFLLLNDTTGTLNRDQYMAAFVKECAPGSFELPKEPRTSQADLRAAALSKSADLQAEQAANPKFQSRKGGKAPDIDLSRTSEVRAKPSQDGKAGVQEAQEGGQEAAGEAAAASEGQEQAKPVEKAQTSGSGNHSKKN